MGIFSLNLFKNNFHTTVKPSNFKTVDVNDGYSEPFILEPTPVYPDDVMPLAPLPSDVACAYFMTCPTCVKEADTSTLLEPLSDINYEFDDTDDIKEEWQPVNPSFMPEGKVIQKIDESGKLLFEGYVSATKSEIKTPDGVTLYSKVMDGEETIETITSLSGQKLFEIKTLPDGTSVKTIFEQDGKNIKSIISYSSDGSVVAKEVISPSRTALSKEDESKIPEYLYHFTSIGNYKSMIHDGFIKTSTDKLLSREGNRGVFFVDSNNLLNGWATKEKGDETSALAKLLKFCDKDSTSELVMLKIPSEKLQKKDITFRVQSEVLNSFAMFNLPQKQQKLYFAFSNLLDEVNDSGSGKKHFDILDSIFMPDRAKQLSQGLQIGEIDAYQQNAIEYVYHGEIPIDIVSDVKMVNISDLANKDIHDNKTEIIAKNILLGVL